jgi:ubiquinol-cytochrome c reductase cytochrome c1 subunit
MRITKTLALNIAFCLLICANGQSRAEEDELTIEDQPAIEIEEQLIEEIEDEEQRGIEEVPVPPHQDWRFNGVFGTFDRAASQRGYQVYREICANCHPMRLIAFRNLAALGFGMDEVIALAALYQVTDGPNDQGEMFRRPAVLADYFPPPFVSDQAARTANNGALPPDLSLIAKAREYGPDYIFAMLTSFTIPPQDVTLNEGMTYNQYFPGHQMSMPDILTDGGVIFQDGTPATAEQQAWDVTNFLMWAAEPNMEVRKRMGVKTVLFLTVFAGIMYAVKRKVWADAH